MRDWDSLNLIQSENKLPTNLEQLTVEIKFYVNQWGQNTIEIGKRLIAAKELVEHGSWGKWLEDNFNFKQSAADKFMAVAKRFGNSDTYPNLNYSQMVTMLSLSAEETEKFISEKAAEGNPVEDMTVKNLREEVAKYKADLAEEKSKVENLFSENARLEKIRGSLTDTLDGTRKNFDKLIIEKNELEQKLKNQKPIEKIPDDYEPLKKERDELQAKISQLEKQLKEKPIEVVNPADYEKNKKELADLKIQYEEFSQVAVIVQTLETISRQIDSIFYSPLLGKGITYYEKTNPVEFSKFDGRIKDFVKNFGE